MFYKFISLNYLKHLIINICNTKEKNSLISPDYFFGILNSGKIEINELLLYLDSINQGKTIELCIHPANKFTDEIYNVKNIGPESFYKDKNRLIEKNLILGDELKKFLTHKKINLINFSEIS